ncbi:hypothetical protein SAMN05216525_16118 [Bradyrhizobium sp. Gha]|nr:hypothetical protein SAMN05216525_16118 [Bradyrhizobium sp. Gha]
MLTEAVIAGRAGGTLLWLVRVEFGGDVLTAGGHVFHTKTGKYPGVTSHVRKQANATSPHPSCRRFGAVRVRSYHV